MRAPFFFFPFRSPPQEMELRRLEQKGLAAQQQREQQRHLAAQSAGHAVDAAPPTAAERYEGGAVPPTTPRCARSPLNDY